MDVRVRVTVMAAAATASGSQPEESEPYLRQSCARCHRNQAGALAGLRVGRARLCSGQLSHRRTRTFTVAAAGTHLSLRSDKSLRQSESGSEADHGSRATGPEKSAGLPSARSRRRQSHESTQADFESRLGVGSSAGRQSRQRRQRPRAAAGLTEAGTAARPLWNLKA